MKILQEIRDEQRATRTELGHLTHETRNARQMFEKRFDMVDKRFEVIETSLRDVAEQLVMVARGVKVAIEARSAGDVAPLAVPGGPLPGRPSH